MALLLLCVCLKRKHPKAASHLLVTKNPHPSRRIKITPNIFTPSGTVFLKQLQLIIHGSNFNKYQVNPQGGWCDFWMSKPAHPSGQCAHPKRCQACSVVTLMPAINGTRPPTAAGKRGGGSRSRQGMIGETKLSLVEEQLSERKAWGDLMDGVDDRRDGETFSSMLQAIYEGNLPIDIEEQKDERNRICDGTPKILLGR